MSAWENDAVCEAVTVERPKAPRRKSATTVNQLKTLKRAIIAKVEVAAEPPILCPTPN
jgi:hypothetical protein